MPLTQPINRSSNAFAFSLVLSVVLHALLTAPAAFVLVFHDDPLWRAIFGSDPESSNAKGPEPVPTEPAASMPELTPPPPPPPESAPAEPEEIRLGIENSKSKSIVWVGFEEATEHSATLSEVEQSGMTPNASGVPVEQGDGPPQEASEPSEMAPAEPMVPETVTPVVLEPLPPIEQPAEEPAPDAPPASPAPAPDPLETSPTPSDEKPNNEKPTETAGTKPEVPPASVLPVPPEPIAAPLPEPPPLVPPKTSISLPVQTAR